MSGSHRSLGDGGSDGDRRELLAGLPAPPGLCARCRHMDLLGSRRAVFLRCALASRDPRYPRYPRLPVIACRGFEAEPPAEP